MMNTFVTVIFLVHYNKSLCVLIGEGKSRARLESENLGVDLTLFVVMVKGELASVCVCL